MRIHVTAATGTFWDLSLDRFADRLAAYRPDSAIAVDLNDARPQVRFELALGADRPAEGIYFTGEWNQLVCWDGTADRWAPVIEWFLGLLPPDCAAEIFLETFAVPHHLPRSATAARIARILTDLDGCA